MNTTIKLDDHSRELLNQLGDRVKLKYSVPESPDCHLVPVDLIWKIVAHFSGKSMQQMIDDGCDANPPG